MRWFSGFPRPSSLRFIESAPFVLLSGLLLLLPVFYFPWTRDVLNPAKTLLLFVGAGVGLLLFALRIFITKELLIRRTILDIPFLFFGGAILLATIASISRSVSLFGWTHDFVLSGSVTIPVLILAWLIIQETYSLRRWQILVTFFLIGALVSGIIFLFGNVLLVREIIDALRLDTTSLNTVSRFNSVFGIYMAAVLAVSIGLLLQKGRVLWAQIIPLLSLLVSLAVIVRLGFSIVWVAAAIATGVILLLGWALVSVIRMSVLAGVFILFIASILFSLFGTPHFLKVPLPTEVTLGVGPSWEIIEQNLFSNAKTFLLGTGPGTFVYPFSTFRPVLFNAANIGNDVRFAQPFNTLYATLSEMGILGGISFLVIAFITLGAVATNIHGMPKKLGERDQLDGLIISSGWVVATFGICGVFLDVTLWWTWWLLLALTLVGLHQAAAPSLIHTYKKSVNISHQARLGISFCLVVAVTLLVIMSAYGIRFLLAEYWFTRATETTRLDVAEAATRRAIQFREGYPDYHVALARVYLQQARLVSEQPNADPVTITRRIALAVNAAKTATDLEPQNVKTWDTLALMYSSARSFAPEANAWATEALERAIALEPSNASLHVRLGIERELAGEASEAEEAYRQALSLKPGYQTAYLRLGSLFEQQSKFDDAVTLYAQALEQLPQDIDIWYELGRMYFNRNAEGDIARAEQIWLAIVREQEQHSNALFSLGILYERLNRRADALLYYERVQKLNPENTEIEQKIKQLRT